MTDEIKPTRKYVIKDVVRESERLIVNADFIETQQDGEDGIIVGSIKHAFPLTLTEEDIEGEVEKACRVFFQDRDRAKANAVKDKLDAEAEVTKANLINKEKSI